MAMEIEKKNEVAEAPDNKPGQASMRSTLKKQR